MKTNDIKDWVTVVLIIGTALVTITGSVYSSQGRLDEFKLQAEKNFSSKTDTKEISLKLDKVQADLSEIKGMLKEKKYSSNLKSLASE